MWWISFAVFGALACLWALTTPLGAGPDEPAHIIKATAVAHGNFDASVVVVHPGPRYSVPRTTLDVPRAIGALTTARDCYILRPDVPASCAPSIGSDTTLAPATTEAGAYPPLYYLLVGWPSRLLAPQPAIYAMRMIGALLAAALLASGLTSATGIGRRRLVVTGAALALTPMAIYLTGVVNPNGLEIAGAFCLWLSLLDLLARADRTERAPARLVVRVVVAAGVVATMRPLSPAFLGLIVVTVGLAAATRGNLRALWSDRRVRAGLAVLGVAVAASAAYVVANRSYDAVMGQTFEDDPTRIDLVRRSWARTLVAPVPDDRDLRLARRRAATGRGDGLGRRGRSVRRAGRGARTVAGAARDAARAGRLRAAAGGGRDRERAEDRAGLAGSLHPDGGGRRADPGRLDHRPLAAGASSGRGRHRRGGGGGRRRRAADRARRGP